MTNPGPKDKLPLRRLARSMRLPEGGAEVVIDYREFAAGLAVRRQMKAAQDKAELHLLVLTPDYLQSDYCVEEMQRAFARDPDFSNRHQLQKTAPIAYAA